MEPLEEITGERERARQFADPNVDICYLATVTAEEQLEEKHTKIWVLGATGSLLPVFFGRTGGRVASGTQSGRDVGCTLRTYSLMRVMPPTSPLPWDVLTLARRFPLPADRAGSHCLHGSVKGRRVWLLL
jgi:hypothetical protein